MATKYPQLIPIARALSVSRRSLWDALSGRTRNVRLVEQYAQLAAPWITNVASLIAAEVDPQTQIYLPSVTQAKRLAEKLQGHCTRSGRMVTITSPCLLIPAVPASRGSKPIDPEAATKQTE